MPLPENVNREYLLGIAEAIAAKALDADELDLPAEVQLEHIVTIQAGESRFSESRVFVARGK